MDCAQQQQSLDLQSKDSSEDLKILGKTFDKSIKEDFWVPGNIIHGELSAIQNEYREMFYKIDKGQTQYGTDFNKYYDSYKTMVVNNQEQLRNMTAHEQTVALRRDTVGSGSILLVSNFNKNKRSSILSLIKFQVGAID
jgi:hypothetical protein